MAARNKPNHGDASTFTKHEVSILAKYQYLELKHGMRRICGQDVVLVST